MNKKIALLTAVMILAVFSTASFWNFKKEAGDEEQSPINIVINDEEFKDPNIFYRTKAFYGLCVTPKGEGVCTDNLYLYLSGKLVTESSWGVQGSRLSSTSSEKQLSKEHVAKIIAEIKNSNILNKECSAEETYDLSETHYINLDGVKKIIRFPGCQDELAKIGALLMDGD